MDNNNTISKKKQKEFENSIDVGLNKECRHVKYSYGVNTYVCNDIVSWINTLHKAGIELRPDLCTKFLKYIIHNFNPNANYYNTSQCFQKNTSRIKVVVDSMFSYYIPDKNTMLALLSNPDYDICFVTLMYHNKQFELYELDKSVFNTIITKKLRHNCDKLDYNKLINGIFDHSLIDFTDGIPDHMVDVRDTFFQNVLSKLVDKDEGPYSYKNLEDLCIHLPYTLPTVRSLLGRGMELNKICLDNACRYTDIKSIQFILDQGRVPIEKRHFEALVKAKKYSGPRAQTYYYYRSTVDEFGFETNSSGYTMEKMELLIKYGYKITYDDVLFAIKQKVEIPGVDRFDVKLDQKLLEICWDYDFYPQNYNFNCITPEMIQLQKLCKSRAKSQINTLIKKQSLVPDRKCMENASNFKSNLPTMRLLVEKGGVVTLKCIKNCVRNLSVNATAEFLVEEFEKVNNEELKKLRNRIKELEVQVAEGKSNNDVKKEVDKEVKKQVDNNVVDSLDDELIDIDDFEDEEIELQPNIIELEEYTNKIPKQKRRRCKVPKKYAKIFKKKSTDKISYMDLRKEFLSKVRQNKWYNVNNKKLIDLPKIVRDEIGIPANGVIRFEDLDKLITYFYK